MPTSSTGADCVSSRTNRPHVGQMFRGCPRAGERDAKSYRVRRLAEACRTCSQPWTPARREQARLQRKLPGRRLSVQRRLRPRKQSISPCVLTASRRLRARSNVASGQRPFSCLDASPPRGETFFLCAMPSRGAAETVPNPARRSRRTVVRRRDPTSVTQKNSIGLLHIAVRVPAFRVSSPGAVAKAARPCASSTRPARSGPKSAIASRCCNAWIWTRRCGSFGTKNISCCAPRA